MMISGAHVVLYSKDADADRTFLRDVLEFGGVDAGGGWMIYALPPTEIAVHPAETGGKHELYLMCDDIGATIDVLQSKGVTCSKPTDEGWGVLTSLRLPSGTEIGLYEPRHATPQ